MVGLKNGSRLNLLLTNAAVYSEQWVPESFASHVRYIR